MQRNFSLYLFLRASNFCTAKAPAYEHANALGVCAHGFLNRLLHSATERNTFLQLFRNAATNQIRIQFRLANLNDIQAHALFRLGLQLGAQLINFLTAATNHNTRLGRMNGNRNLVRSSALNLNTRNRCIRKLFVNDLAQFKIFRKQIFIITLSVPARLPTFDNAEPETCGMYFVSQSVLLLSVLRQPGRPKRPQSHGRNVAKFALHDHEGAL
jgi:hypothetical protein